MLKASIRTYLWKVKGCRIQLLTDFFENSTGPSAACFHTINSSTIVEEFTFFATVH
jgi:hypothetical protein